MSALEQDFEAAVNGADARAGVTDFAAGRRMKVRLLVHPLGDRVVVMPSEVEDTVEEQFAMPGESAKERPQVARVLAVGPGKRHPMTGELMPVNIEVGQDVLHGLYAGTEITLEGKTFKILREDECSAVLVREEVEDDSPVREIPVTDGGWPPPGVSTEPLEDQLYSPPRRCIDEGHGEEVPLANFEVKGPHFAEHGLLYYCELHARAYETAMTDLGHVVTLTPIERG